MGFRISNLLRSVGLCVGLAAALIGCASEEPEIPDQPAEVLYTNALNALEEGKAPTPPGCSRRWSASTPIPPGRPRPW